ncbi:MAG: sugar nucleotide-binding protein [Spirochaetia bacterium]|nr:sugar nucleotide-binding protein [Spirochaetia bacterium]
MTTSTADRLSRPRVLCLGAGFTSLYLARHFASQCDVSFLSRRPREIEAAGFQTFDAGVPADLIFDTTPSADGGGIAYARELETVMAQNPRHVYLHVSTTSVYGGADAAVPYTVNEGTAPAPESASSEARLTRETRILSQVRRSCVIRAGGIYGPGRSLGESFRAGDFRRVNTGNRIVSRIHVHDLCALALAWQAAFDDVSDPRIVNGVDDYPATNSEVFQFLESLLDIELPDNPGQGQESWRTGAPVGRRVESLFRARILPGLSFPSYREGFRSCLSM